MSMSNEIERALSQTISTEFHDRLSPLAQLLAQLYEGSISIEEAQEQLNLPLFAALLRELDGAKPIQTSQAQISFGTGNTFGSVTIGDIAGGNMIRFQVHMIEAAYDVRGLPNPYIGLRSFTYAERERFGGRVRLITHGYNCLVGTPGDEKTVLFISGASGSGKSSLAQAGLLPALEKHYEERRLRARRAVITPRTKPLESLQDGLQQLGMPAYELDISQLTQQPQELIRFLQEHTPPDQRNLLIIDQFEELFTLTTEEKQRTAFVELLSSLPVFRQIRTHIILTVRADYRDALAMYKPLYEMYLQSQQRMDVGAMDANELIDAIEHPIKATPAIQGKTLEPGLLQRFIREASGDSAYLPLLQVTLEDLWRRGSLTLQAYGQNTLASAIQQRADIVLHYSDYDGSRNQGRSAEHQQIILDLFIDLIKVPIDNDEIDIDRVVRRRLPLDEAGKDDQQRRFLIDELSRARLLSKDTQSGVDGTFVEVTIIHDALIRAWGTLREYISLHAEELRRVERFRVALQEWVNNRLSQQFLLVGGRLREAELLQQEDAAVLRNPQAQTFLNASLARRRREQITRSIVSALVFMLIVGIGIAALIAWEQQQGRIAESFSRATAEANEQERAREAQTAQAQAEMERIITESQRLAEEAQSQSNRAEDTELGLLLAIEAFLRHQSTLTEQALRDNLARFRWKPPVIGGGERPIRAALLSPDAMTIAVSYFAGETRLWDEKGTTLTTVNGVMSAGSAFHPDSKSILTFTSDGTIHRWDRNGTELVSIQHLDVSQALFSPDGQTILTAAQDGSLRLWDLQGQLRWTTDMALGAVSVAAFTPDGQSLLVGTMTGALTLFTSDGIRVFDLYGHAKEITSIAFSQDGQIAATSSRDGSAYIWDLPNGFPRAQMSVGAAIYDIAVSPNGDAVAIASANSMAQVYDLDGRQSAVLVGALSNSAPQPVYVVAFSPDGQTILTGSRDTTARLWDRQGNPIAVLEGHSDEVIHAQFSASGQLIMTASGSYEGQAVGSVPDYSVRLWSASGSAISIFHGNERSVNKVVFSPNGHYLLLSSTITRLLDLQGQEYMMFPEPGSYEFSPDGEHILAISSDGNAQLWKMPTENNESLQSQALQVELTTDGVVGTSSEGTIPLWDIDARLFNVPDSTLSGVFYTTYSPDGRYIVTTTVDNEVILYNRQTQAETVLAGHPAPVDVIVFSPDGKTLIAASSDDYNSEDYTARLWSVQGQELAVFSGHTNAITTATFSQDGQTILTTSFDQTSRLWNLQGEQLALFAGHTSWVSYGSFSPNGQYIVTTSQDGTVRLWDLAGTPLTVFQGHTDIVRYATFSPDGKYIVTGSDDGTARLWPVEGQSLVGVAVCRVSRELTDAELQQFGITSRAFSFAERSCPYIPEGE